MIMSQLRESAKNYFDHYDKHLIWGLKKKILSLNNMNISKGCLFLIMHGVFSLDLFISFMKGKKGDDIMLP